MKYIKAEYYQGGTLGGRFLVTRKVDGVRAFKDEKGHAVSRNGKPLFNLDGLEFQDAEIFRDNIGTSVGLVRSPGRKITQDDVYELTDGEVDKRLHIQVVNNPTEKQILELLKTATVSGYEGIVLRGMYSKAGTWIKVVPTHTADIRITGYKMGKGKLEGYVGSWQTNHGSVSANAGTERLREKWAQDPEHMVGKIIEVEYREITEKGKLRFPVFVGERFDKDTESI